jgi:hypothetical protein
MRDTSWLSVCFLRVCNKKLMLIKVKALIEVGEVVAVVVRYSN